MDIAPPPVFSATVDADEKIRLKKKMKRNRYKKNRKMKTSTSTSPDGSLSHITHEDKESLRLKFKKQMRGLQTVRSGDAKKRMDMLRSTIGDKNGKVNPYDLMDKLGVKDPAVREKVAQMATSGNFGNVASLEKLLH